jgi:hypothetical protein
MALLRILTVASNAPAWNAVQIVIWNTAGLLNPSVLSHLPRREWRNIIFSIKFKTLFFALAS